MNDKPYVVVEQTDRTDFENVCAKYLAMGYTPIGSMSAESDDDGLFGPWNPETTYRQSFYKTSNA